MAKTATKTSTKRRSSIKSLKKSAAPRESKRTAADSTSEVGEDDVTIDRRHDSDRRDDEPVSVESAAAPKLERRKKVNRRRQIDPTTCERDYTEQEVEFMNALDDYKRKSGRMFPTCSEVLEVINSLGYVKLSAGQITAAQANHSLASAKPMPQDLQVSASDEVFAAAGEQLV